MNAEQKNRYFQELALNLRHEGFTVKPETAEGLLPVELDSQRLCLALDTGAVRYWREDVAGDSRSAALDRATDIARITAEYMSQMEAAPQLTASGLKGDYRLLADFNDVVLAGHPTKYGVQFVTWARIQEGTALDQGHYYGHSVGKDSYTAAKQDLPVQAVRLDKIVTGTYNVQGNYKIVYKTNLNSEYRTMYDNLSTMQNNVLDASPAALGLASNEYVTEFMVSFGIVPGNFRQVEAPKVYCSVVSWLTGGTQFVNQADVGGVYNGQWISATTRWVTSVYKPSTPLPRTGY